LTVDFVVCTLAVKKKIRAGFDISDRKNSPVSPIVRPNDKRVMRRKRGTQKNHEFSTSDIRFERSAKAIQSVLQ
jgi:hypothetical protein